jgi:hypothetical protein
LEKLSKNRRGRPRKISTAEVASLRATFPDMTTSRSINNAYYRQVAYRYLRPKEHGSKYDHIIDFTTGRMRRTILVALGRLADQCDDEREAEEWIRVAAEDICEERMKTSEALEFISDVRFVQRVDLD